MNRVSSIIILRCASFHAAFKKDSAYISAWINTVLVSKNKLFNIHIPFISFSSIIIILQSNYDWLSESNKLPEPFSETVLRAVFDFLSKTHETLQASL